jgi:hypothetical protein
VIQTILALTLIAGPVRAEMAKTGSEPVATRPQQDPDSQFLSCQSKSSTAAKPKVSWLQRKIPKEDNKGIKAQDFLKALFIRLEEVATENVTFSKNIQFCMSKGGTTSGCNEMRKEWIDADGGLKFKIEEARYHLALAQGPTDPRSVMGAANDGVNNKLWTTGVHKEVRWKPMTPSEVTAAKLLLKNYEEPTKASIRSQGLNGHDYSSRRLFMDKMIPIRRGHWNEYRNIMSSVPLLQFISSLNPSDEEIAGAAYKQQDLALQERDKFRTWSKKLEAGDGSVPSDLLAALDYKNVVEEVLKKSPQFCGVATGLAEVRDQRELGNVIVPLGAVIVLSALTPPTVAVGIGLGAGAVGAGQSYKEFHDARSRALSEIVAENGVSNASDLDDLSQSFAQAATAGMALNAVGAGGTSKAAAVLRSQKLFNSVIKTSPVAAKPIPAAYRTSIMSH